MIQSMTGFGSYETIIPGLGRVSVELRSTNHKFLETVLHLPEGSLAMEERIKKAIEAKVKRGRVTCSLNMKGGRGGDVFINKPLLKNYLYKIKSAQKEFRLKESLGLDTLILLPGVLTLEEGKVSPANIWPKLKSALNLAISNLVKTRAKEGMALQGYLKKQAEELRDELAAIRARLKDALQEKLKTFATDEDRANFLKDTDTTEEADRLSFHIRNFKNRLTKGGAVGKELDFIAQEMQREANTMAAKTFDVSVSAKVLKMKSLIEKIREQAQNVE
ncbi:MAG: YicC family protein [Candidatus Omnitrophica bacterium]|nr:YicC family protein [Candidatus Omnitrophota bacterium]